MDDESERRLQLKRDFGDFLDQDHGHGEYPAKIKAALSRANIEAAKCVLQPGPTCDGRVTSPAPDGCLAEAGL